MLMPFHIATIFPDTRLKAMESLPSAFQMPFWPVGLLGWSQVLCNISIYYPYSVYWPHTAHALYTFYALLFFMLDFSVLSPFVDDKIIRWAYAVTLHSRHMWRQGNTLICSYLAVYHISLQFKFSSMCHLWLLTDVHFAQAISTEFRDEWQHHSINILSRNTL